MGLKHTRIIATLCMAAMATTAYSQTESTNRVSSNTDWSVFTEESLQFDLLCVADFAVDIGVYQVCKFLLYSH